MKSLEVICKECANPMGFAFETIFRNYIYRCSKCGSESIAFKDGSGTVRVQPRDFEEDLNQRMTLHFKASEILVADEMVSATVVIGNSLTEAAGDDSVSFNIGIETTWDLRASIQLALLGYYRHANMLLRSWLELTTVGVYFDDHRDKYKEWQEDCRNSPSFKLQCLQSLFSVEPYRKFEEKYALSQEVNSLYKELSKFTHARGWGRWGISSYGLGGKLYSEEYFETWFSNLRKTFELTCTMLFIKYPPLTKAFSQMYVDGTDMTQKFLDLISHETKAQWRNARIL
jgi:hypothetical protein